MDESANMPGITFGYDTIADAAVLLINDHPTNAQLELENGVIICLGKSGEIVSIEILDFSKHQDLKELEKNAENGIPITISHTRLMDEQYMKHHYPQYCAAQERLGKCPWGIIWNRWKKAQLKK